MELFALLCAPAVSYYLLRSSWGQGNLMHAGIAFAWAAVQVGVIAAASIGSRRFNIHFGLSLAVMMLVAALSSFGAAWYHEPGARTPRTALVLPVIGHWPGIADSVYQPTINVSVPAKHSLARDRKPEHG